MNPRRRRLAERWLALGSPVVLLLAWEVASANGLLREAFFPRPSTVLAHLGRLGADGTLPGHTLATLGRIAWAFALSAVLGVAVGLAMGVWRRLREGLDPVFAVVYPIPSVLFLPLVSFLVPRGETALVVTTAVTSFFLVAF
ncbi:MAG TPA: ABC transporter permease, partial [Methylomirabilota bacterium]|nr:ABC transporter permease [Methylomirabilota bacterium]